jgi:hypothetical protein
MGIDPGIAMHAQRGGAVDVVAACCGLFSGKFVLLD